MGYKKNFYIEIKWKKWKKDLKVIKEIKFKYKIALKCAQIARHSWIKQDKS